ncbi:hypothetical protein IMG5_001260 [Ichthyophthirius multifiliis]|uniref:Pre-mRNA-splicing factor CWC26 n=1 Tax=Ichthyophthirius multifiliis TaxID=5932 RepID=G0QIR8_ICHMU|nr:hypothetical protein IMG5_001260 [Ichthyophthirius multifiliis]EGR34897.1 hypothetical protein IMG5_001260 [Ichthyophthirius multifiliis]|eukprot:XP_004040201.1 hypothetical protein IMG5_001260 [Ichthyophthirius multifiliis]
MNQDLDNYYDENNEEYAPIIVETAESSKYTKEQKEQVIQEQKKKKIRHDSESEEENQQNEDQKKLDAFRSKINKALDQEDNQPETVYRDALGRKVSARELLNQQKTKKDKIEELKIQNQERIDQWGKGLKQKEDKQNQKEAIKNAKNELYVGEYAISKQTEIELMKQTRFNDPMQNLIDKEDQKITQAKLNLGKNFCRLQCKFPPVSNRFNILPGHMWDGVDRGNQFEARYFDMLNKKKDRARKAHVNDVAQI